MSLGNSDVCRLVVGDGCCCVDIIVSFRDSYNCYECKYISMVYCGMFMLLTLWVAYSISTYSFLWRVGNKFLVRVFLLVCGA
jgi:hypothetical protein